MKFKKLASSFLVVGVILSAPIAVRADEGATPVDQLETEMLKLNDVYDDIVPVAIGAAAFSIGMILIKRIAFS